MLTAKPRTKRITTASWRYAWQMSGNLERGPPLQGGLVVVLINATFSRQPTALLNLLSYRTPLARDQIKEELVG